jgi:hypothetical protein
MSRAIRDRLVDLLLRAFRDPRTGDAILCLRLYWGLRFGEREAEVTLFDLETTWARRYPQRVAQARDRAAAVAALKGILAVRPRTAAQRKGLDRSTTRVGAALLVEPHPTTLPFLPALRERTNMYAQVIEEVVARKATLDRMPALNRAVAEAAVCFNTGLFFEAHEHLEHHWVRLARGPNRRFLQGLIQISVGCHHAMRGSYDGAVNQLGKGLAKLTEAPGDMLGLRVDRLCRETQEARQEIVARGRDGMRPARLEELPRIYRAA